MIQIVIPMAGRGSRFSDAGILTPKPLIQVGGKPMIQWVIENIRPSKEHQFTFICLDEHLIKYPDVLCTLKNLCPGCNIVRVNQVTEGAACTVLLAKDFINTQDELMIANADQIVDANIDDYLDEMASNKADGLIMTFESNHPKWSFCKMNDKGDVTEVVEKQVVSDEATVGIYNFKHGADFVRAAQQMIERNLRVNGEFYVAPAYNQLICEGKKITVFNVGKEYDGMYGLGIPTDLKFFETTSFFQDKRSDGVLAVDEKLSLRSLTELYVEFFNSRNIAGVKALLSQEFALEDPGFKRMEGKDKVIDYINDIFKTHHLEFKARKIMVEDQSSLIEFELEIGEQRLKGVDIIEWENQKIKELRAYLY